MTTITRMSLDDRDEELNQITGSVVDAAMRVHSELGPGLLERVYQIRLGNELLARGHRAEREVALPLVYRGERLDAGFRLDMVVDGRVLGEVNSVEDLHRVHVAQVLTYPRLAELPVGLLINFNVIRLKNGLVRLVPRDANAGSP